MMIYVVQKYLKYTKPNTVMRFFLLFFIVLNTSAFSQISENWSDNDFSTPPVWSGDLNKFIILTSEQKLKLNAEAVTSDAFLSSSSEAINNASWEFTVHLDFNPSSSNYVKVFLTSNQANFDDNIEGYYVMIGNTEDEVSLWKRNNGSNKEIIDGIDKILNSSANSVSVKVIRDDSGNWQLFTKQESENYTTQGEVFDDDFIHSSFFGIYCKYTSTRSNKISFGPITVSGSGYVDNDKPSVLIHQFIAGNQFSITFNENINPASVLKSNFEIAPNSINPDDISINSNSVDIYFNEYLKDTSLGQLKVKNIEDESGNTINDTTLNYSFKRIKLTKHKVINENSIQLTFSKNIDESVTILNPITGDINLGYPTILNDTTLILISDTQFEPDLNYQLSISGIKAEFGDIIKDTTITIVYRKPERYDLIFSEFMPDPTPNVGLFNSEYIEIYNREEYAINLEGMQLIINNKESILPEYLLLPNSYVVITNQNNLESWPNNIPLIGVKSLPALTNSSGILILYHTNGLVCDVISYPLNLSDDGFKSDGGWSFERIDSNNHQPDNNWAYSVNLDGGTPGNNNSVIDSNPDTHAPFVRFVSYIDPKNFQLVFNESLSQTESFDVSTIEIQGANISDISVEPVFLNSIKISLAEDLPVKQIFNAKFNSNIVDFAGNDLFNWHSLRLGVPEEIDSLDICINEILFNPAPDGIDFVELFNKSDKIINRSDIYLSSITDLVLDKLNQADDKNQLLFPGDYLVVTEDSMILLNNYPSINSELINQADLPSLNDDEGNIAIAKNNGKIVDYIEYTDDIHFELLRDKEGVSLERINPNATSNNAHNWHSASKSSGYATPSFQNSQYSNSSTNIENNSWLKLDKEEFSPNADGFDDFVQINYNLSEPGWSGSITIYNRYGQAIKQIADNELLNQQGFFNWDGTTDNHEKAAIGIYIIYADFFSSNGKTKQEKTTVVLTAGGNK